MASSYLKKRARHSNPTRRTRIFFRILKTLLAGVREWRLSCRRNGANATEITMEGRHGTFTGNVEPKRSFALVGPIAPLDLELLVDCHYSRRVPRDPHGLIFEIE